MIASILALLLIDVVALGFLLQLSQNEPGETEPFYAPVSEAASAPHGTIEGVVTFIGNDTVCISGYNEDLTLRCDTQGARFEAEEISAGDHVIATYFSNEEFDNPSLYTIIATG